MPEHISFEENLVRYCAPALAGAKTGGLFSQVYSDREKLFKKMNDLNHIFVKKGLRLVPLKVESGRALIYLYRVSSLSRDFEAEDTRKVLKKCGYKGCDPCRCLCALRSRICSCDEFPHEIGLFLGYPPCDVEGFMNSSRGYKCCGAWKVYGNVEEAKKKFRMYRKCEENYIERFRCGQSLDSLAVAG